MKAVILAAGIASRLRPVDRSQTQMFVGDRQQMLIGKSDNRFNR